MGRCYAVRKSSAVFLLLASVWTSCAAGLPVALDLAGTWKLRDADDTNVVCAATVPGGVFGALLAAGKIPDPCLGDNEKKVQWVGRHRWIFTRTFDVDAVFLSHREIILRLEDVDTFATVVVNGHVVGRTSNRFRRWDFDVRPSLKGGRNTLELRFDSSEVVCAARGKQRDRFYWMSNVTVQGINLIRKSACHGGWDWGPTVMETGPCGTVVLIASEDDRIDYVYDEQIFKGDLSHCTLRLFAALGDGSIVTNRLEIDHPPLWWPNGMGEQKFYSYAVPVAGRLLKGRVGLRRLSVSTAEGGLAFSVNNRPLFVRGANWIPSDALASRETPTRKRQLLDAAVAANMNMVRVWGGGHFESDDFYAACDERGLLVWQDMMFSCAVYPGTKAFLAEVRAEATHQVRRLRGHPSLALWCGDNECIQIPHEHRTPEERAFHFSNLTARVSLLRTVVRTNDPTRLFWPGSPCQGEYDLSYPKLDADRGDFHCWPPVAKGQRLFEPHLRFRPRFASEYGFMSRSLCDGDGHCKCPRLERAMRDEMTACFPVPRDTRAAILFTQFAQAEALTAVTMCWRSDRPTCKGVLYWQLNDVWPVSSWSTIEYDGRWKPAHYAVRRAFAPLAAALVGDVVKLVNDGNAPSVGTLCQRVWTFDGRIVAEKRQEVVVDSDAVVSASALPFAADQFLEMSFGAVRAIATKKPWKDLPLVDPEMSVRCEGCSAVLTVRRPAFHVWCEVVGHAGAFSDNDFTLLPDQPVRVTFKGSATPVEFKRSFAVASKLWYNVKNKN